MPRAKISIHLSLVNLANHQVQNGCIQSQGYEHKCSYNRNRRCKCKHENKHKCQGDDN